MIHKYLVNELSLISNLRVTIKILITFVKIIWFMACKYTLWHTLFNECRILKFIVTIHLFDTFLHLSFIYLYSWVFANHRVFAPQCVI